MRPTIAPVLLEAFTATPWWADRHHGIDPHHFLRETHHFPEIGNLGVGRANCDRIAAPAWAQDRFLYAPSHYSRRSWRRWAWTTCSTRVLDRTYPLPAQPDVQGSADWCVRIGCCVALHHGRGQPGEPAHRQRLGMRLSVSNGRAARPPGDARMSVTSCGYRDCCTCGSYGDPPVRVNSRPFGNSLTLPKPFHAPCRPSRRTQTPDSADPRGYAEDPKAGENHTAALASD